MRVFSFTLWYPSRGRATYAPVLLISVCEGFGDFCDHSIRIIWLNGKHPTYSRQHILELRRCALWFSMFFYDTFSRSVFSSSEGEEEVVKEESGAIMQICVLAIVSSSREF